MIFKYIILKNYILMTNKIVYSDSLLDYLRSLDIIPF